MLVAVSSMAHAPFDDPHHGVGRIALAENAFFALVFHDHAGIQ